MGIVFAKTQPKERVVNNAVVNTTLRIPPGAPNHEVQGTVTFLHDTRIGGFGPHMHVRGKAMRNKLLQSEATAQTLCTSQNITSTGNSSTSPPIGYQ